MDKIDAKRIWLITDTHFGVRNNSGEWMEIISEYFNDWFIPLVKKNYQPGDILVHLGDVYDSRQSLNLKVLNLGIDVFEKLSEVFDGIYVMVGNHDLWGKTSNDINSLKSLKWIPKVKILEEPESIMFGDKSFFFMPWRKDHEAEGECLDHTIKHDFLCCHADIRGLKFNRYVKIEKGVDIAKLKKFGRVYCGHIHYGQEHKNIKLLGSPYEITRADIGNPKGVVILDLATGAEAFIENTYSPKHKKIDFNVVLDMTMEEADKEFKNNFIDVTIDPRMALKAPLNILTDTITSAKKISFHPYDPNQAGLILPDPEDVNYEQFSIMDFVKSYVENMEHDDETKEKLLNSIGKLHTIVTTNINK